MVTKAIAKLKSDTSDTLNKIYSDSFIDAPDILLNLFASIYTFMLSHGISNEIFNLIIFSPLI